MIDDMLKTIWRSVGVVPTAEQLRLVRLTMASYAMYAVMDSKIAEEADAICNSNLEAHAQSDEPEKFA